MVVMIIFIKVAITWVALALLLRLTYDVYGPTQPEVIVYGVWVISFLTFCYWVLLTAKLAKRKVPDK